MELQDKIELKRKEISLTDAGETKSNLQIQLRKLLMKLDMAQTKARMQALD